MIRKFSVAFMLILCLTGTALAQHDTPLRDVLLPEGCEQTCYLGIKPGVTPQDAAEALLEQAGVAYNYGRADIDLDTVFYRYLITDLTAFPYSGPHSHIVIFTLTDTGEIPQISIAGLDNLTVSQVASEFGPPTRVIAGRGGARAEIVYENYLLSFIVNEDDIHIDSLGLLSPATYALGYNNTNAFDIQPCTEPVALCSIVLATPPAASAGPDQPFTDFGSSGSEPVTQDRRRAPGQAQPRP